MKPSRLNITIFGGSQLKPDDPAYKQALRLGRILGDMGYSVITGGYIGTMEAVSRGASEAGAHVIGITCDEIERWRPVGPNPWVKEERRYPTLRQRLYALIEGCDAALALPGGIGTLAEISVMWSQLQVGEKFRRPLILIGSEWKRMMDTFHSLLGDYILEEDRELLSFSPDVFAAVNLLSTLLVDKHSV